MIDAKGGNVFVGLWGELVEREATTSDRDIKCIYLLVTKQPTLPSEPPNTHSSAVQCSIFDAQVMLSGTVESLARVRLNCGGRAVSQ